MVEGTKPPCIGIDLGTTNSCVGVWQNGEVIIVKNDQGQKTTPSFVSFGAAERKIGGAAVGQAARNPENTIYGAKRLIGLKMDDPKLMKDMENIPFEIQAGDGNKPLIVVKHQMQERKFHAEEISSMILVKMRECAEEFTKLKPIKDAVITCPAYFNDAQRQATRDAGEIAGLNVLSVINEPTAAAIAYGLERKQEKKSHVLVYDFGGGTLDCTLLTIEKGDFRVLSTNGNTHLGGEDFDNALMSYCTKEFQNTSGIDISKSAKSMRRMKAEVQKAKHMLSTSSEYEMTLDSLAKDEDFEMTITREKFEEVCANLFVAGIPCVEKCLEDGKVDKGQVDDIVLVGGTSRIPKVQQVLSNYFNGKQLCFRVNPDEAVAYGATVQAAMLTDQTDDEEQQIQFQDVVPLSLGTDVTGGKMSFIIERNTPIPCRGSEKYRTVRDNQEKCGFMVYQGEEELYKDNHFLGKFTLTDIPPRPKGEPDRLECIMEVDKSGLLKVTAIDHCSGQNHQLEIKIQKQGNLNDEQINRMKLEAEQFAEQDRNFNANVAAKVGFEQFINKMEAVTKDAYGWGKLTQIDQQTVQALLEEANEWLAGNQDATPKAFEKKMDELNGMFKPLERKTVNLAPIELDDDAWN